MKWCVMDLVTDEKTGRLSGAKVWQQIGFAAATWVFIHQQAVTYELMLVYTGVVAGNNLGIYWLKRKYNAELDTAGSTGRRSKS